MSRRGPGAALVAALLAVLCLTAGPGVARAAEPPRPEGRAWALIDARTGATLLSHAAAERLPIASTTKLMTAYVAMQELPLDKIVRAAPYHPIYGESLLGLRTGQRISVRDLLYGLILRSGNDAAHDLALAAAGSDPPLRRRDEPPRRRARARRHPLRQPGRARPARQLLQRPRPGDPDPAPAADARLRQDRRLAQRRPAQPPAAAADRDDQRAAAGRALGDRGQDRPHLRRRLRASSAPAGAGGWT